jgi:hypothetical protein
MKMLLSSPQKIKVVSVSTAFVMAFIMLKRRGYSIAKIYFSMKTNFHKFVEIVKTNQFLQAVFIPSALGVVYYWFQTYILNEVVSKIRSLFYCAITISSKDENFKPVVDYLAKQLKDGNTLLTAETKKKKRDKNSWRREWNGVAERNPPEMDYRPAKSGATMTFQFEGHEIYLWRTVGQTVTTGHARVPLELENLTIATFAGKIDVLKSFINAALRDSFEEASDETNIYVLSDGWLGGWEKAMTKKPRSKDSIVLDGNISETLIEDARNFLQSSEWYAERGIPYRRGYLLHGPPGCGKTSFTQVLAGALKLDVCMLSLSNSSLDDAKLAQNFREAPENSIILLEDVDAVFVDRDVQKKGKSGGGTGVSFSGLLNAIDGVASQEGRLFFMTTNYPEKLDSALVRPGRCDVKLPLRRASRNQMRRLFRRFFPNCTDDEAHQFAVKLPEFELSMAMLQGHLLQYRDSSYAAIENVPSLLRASKPQEVKRQTIYNHLKRVGLERLACLFEKHGYRYQSDLHGLTLKTVQDWDVELQYDFLQSQKLKRLLEEEKELMNKEYPLASIATIRDAFFAAYPIVSMRLLEKNETRSRSSTEENIKADDIDDILPPPPTLLRQTSYEKSKQIKHDDATKSIDSNESVDAIGLTGGTSSVGVESKSLIKSPRSRKRAETVDSIESRLEKLAKELAEKLSKDGKGNVSLWQLNHLLSENPYPEYAVLNASCLTEPRTDSSRILSPMTTYQWLKRAGYHKLWYYFEDAGYVYAHELKSGLKSIKDIKNIGVNANDAKIIYPLIANDASDRNKTCALLHPFRSRIQHLFRLAHPDCSHQQAHDFASVLTDAQGYGKCSVRQLEMYLWDKSELFNEGEGEEDNDDREESENEGETKKEGNKKVLKGRRHSSPQEALDNCLKALINIKKEKKPLPSPKPRPSSWIHKTLTTHFGKSYAQYAKKMVDAGLPEKEDIIVDPPLDCGDLETIGISIMGHQRAIIRYFKRLTEGEDDGVLKKNDSISCDFGNGKVLEHNKDTDFYNIQLVWGGTLHCYEENLNIKRILKKEMEKEEEKKEKKLEILEKVLEKVESTSKEKEMEKKEESEDENFKYETKEDKRQRKKNRKNHSSRKNKKNTNSKSDSKEDDDSVKLSCKKEFPALGEK